MCCFGGVLGEKKEEALTGCEKVLLGIISQEVGGRVVVPGLCFFLVGCQVVDDGCMLVHVEGVGVKGNVLCVDGGVEKKRVLVANTQNNKKKSQHQANSSHFSLISL